MGSSLWLQTECVMYFYRSTRTTCTHQISSSTPLRRSYMRWALSTSTMWNWPPSTPLPRDTLESEYPLQWTHIDLLCYSTFETVLGVHIQFSTKLKSFFSCFLKCLLSHFLNNDKIPVVFPSYTSRVNFKGNNEHEIEVKMFSFKTRHYDIMRHFWVRLQNVEQLKHVKVR